MLKKSKQRNEILKILSTKNYHPNTDEIYMFVKKKLPNVGIATIYRNLEQLLRMGEIVKIDVPHGSACYDGNMEKHDHILCTNCSRLQDVWLNKDIIDFTDVQKSIPDFRIDGYKIDFRGLCKNCSEKDNE